MKPTLRKSFALLPALAALFVAAPALAIVERAPQQLSVSAESATTTIIRYNEDTATPFTTTEALFCYALLPNKQCSPGTTFGRLPPALDRGSTTTPVTSITDVMTVPYSVTRAALLRAQQGLFSDFYYVRRFTPASIGPRPGDLGAGPGVDVYIPVTLRLSGPSGNVPLSLTKVEIYATEGDDPKHITLVRLSNSNLDTGRVHARINYTGSGRLEGWWEVRQASDPPLRPEDLVPEASLPPAQRGSQQQFLRVKRISIPVFSGGQMVVDGPRYSELPQILTGRSQILLRIEEFRDPNSRSSFTRAGPADVVYSGASAAFALPPLEYYVPAGLAPSPDRTPMRPRMTQTTDAKGNAVFKLAWTPIDDTRLVVEFVAGPPGAERRVIAPAGDGTAQLPGEWAAFYRAGAMTATIRGPNNEAISPPEVVAVDQAGR